MMRVRHFVASTLGTLTLSASILAAAQNAPPAPGGGLTNLEFKPALDDLMTMLVQPRHIKLYYAGQAKNWRLAEMTAACNACHAGLEHPFVVIKVPNAPNYPDQEFRP